MVLDTLRLRLRPYREPDRHGFVELVSDPELMDRLGGPVHAPEALFEQLIGHDPASRERAWAITLRADDAVVGHIWLEGLCEALPPQLGFVIGSSYAGRGLATEAATAVLHYSLTVRGLPAIEATVDPDHVASQRVLEKIGLSLARQQHDEAGLYLVYSNGPGATPA